MLEAGLCVLIIFNAQQPVANLWTLILDTARDCFLLRLWWQGEVLPGHCPCYMRVPHMANVHWGFASP